MRIIDPTDQGKAGRKANFIDQARSRLGPSRSNNEARAEEFVIAALQKGLDHKYVILRNTTLQGPDIPIPLILVGPLGVWVIYASPLKGLFRAKEDSWEELDDRTQRFTISRPNLVTRTQLMARALKAYLAEHEVPVQEVEPVLFFSDPGIHIDASRPVVRIVLADALDRFAAGLTQGWPSLDSPGVQKIVRVLAGDQPYAGEARPVGDDQDAFSFRDLPIEKPVQKKKAMVDQSEPVVLKRIPFSSRQWMFLGIMILVNIFILASFVIFILMTS